MRLVAIALGATSLVLTVVFGTLVALAPNLTRMFVPSRVEVEAPALAEAHHA